MSWMRYIANAVSCDRCGETFHVHTDETKRAVRKRARADGWSFRRVHPRVEHATCWECKTTRKTNEEAP